MGCCHKSKIYIFFMVLFCIVLPSEVFSVGIVNSQTVISSEAAKTITMIKLKEKETVDAINEYKETLLLNIKALLEKNKKLAEVLVISKSALMRKKKALADIKAILSVKATESKKNKRIRK